MIESKILLARYLPPSTKTNINTKIKGISKANPILAYKKVSFENLFAIKQSDEKLDYSAEFPIYVK